MSIFSKIGKIFQRKEGGSLVGNLLRTVTHSPLNHQNTSPLGEVQTSPLGDTLNRVNSVLDSARNTLDKGVNTQVSINPQSAIMFGLGVIVFYFLMKKK